MSYMYRAIGTTAVGTPSSLRSVSLPHDQNQILRVFFDGGPIMPLLLPARVVCKLVGCWPAVILPGCLQFPLSFLPFEEARSRPVRSLGRSFFPCPSVRASVRRRWENGSVQLAVTLVSFATAAGLLSFRTRH